MPSLHIAPCSLKAAEYACQNYHYSGKLAGLGMSSATFGVWEDETFLGSVIYALGASPNIGKPFGLVKGEVCELVRIALNRHETPVSRIMSITLKMLHKSSKGLRVVVSYADTAQGHHGGIYQACGWLYLGVPKSTEYYFIRGRVVHPRSVHSRWGNGAQSLSWLRKNVDPKASRVPGSEKHKYVWCFDDELREKIATLAIPYPKRAPGA